MEPLYSYYILIEFQLKILSIGRRFIVGRSRENWCNCEEHHKPKPEKKKHKRKHHKHTETILKCGTAAGSAPLSLNNIVVNGAAINGYGFQPIVQATVPLDTSNLINPTVKIDFSSLISFRTSDEDNYFLRLAFRLSKICSGGPIPLGTWTFERVSQETEVTPVEGEYVQGTDAFCFNWCECDDCPDCCRYIVEIIDQQFFNIAFAAVTNISLSAIAVGQKKHHY
jgi:hypothetical protein